MTVLVVAGLVFAAACSEKGDETGERASTSTTGANTDTPTGASSVAGTAGASTGGSTAEPDAPQAATVPESEAEPQYGGSIRVAGESEVGQPWTPALMQCDSFCYMRAMTFYDTLTRLDSNLHWQPYLAERIVPNGDDTAFRFTIRRGITFHDGTPLDGDAVIYNLNEAVTSPLTGPALADVARNADGTLMVKRHDRFSFTLFTGRDGDANEPVPWPLFPGAFALQVGFIASPTWLQAVKDGSASASEPVGTGPFEVRSYRSGDRLHVVRSDDYWLHADNGDQLPYLDEIEFRVVPDSLVREQALTSGDVDMISTSDGSVVQELSSDSEFRTLVQDRYAETNYILLHVGKPDSPLNSQQVRCALLQAVDREQLTDMMTDGFNEVANGPFSPGQEGYLEDNGLPPYDPDAAAAAIEAYEADHGPVSLRYSTIPTGPTRTQAAFIKESWAAIGVDVNIDEMEQSEFITAAVLGADTFDAFGWRGHSGFFVDGQSHWWNSRTASPPGEFGLNFGRIRDDVIDENLRTARSSADPAVRRRAAQTINRRFAEQCYVIPGYYTKWGISTRNGIENVGRLTLPDGGVATALNSGWTPLTAAFLAE